MQKYKYLLDYVSSQKMKIGVFVDYKQSSLPIFLQNKFCIKLEVYAWLLIKGINPFLVQIISHSGKLGENDIILFSTFNALDNADFAGGDFYDNSAIKLVHFTHYFYNTSIIAKNIREMNIDFIISENNLQKGSAYFQHFFNTVYKKSVYHLPFSFAKRFQRYTAFKDRCNKVISVGALAVLDDNDAKFKDFHSWSNDKYLHPIRKVVALDEGCIASNFIESSNISLSPVNQPNISHFQRFLGRLKMIFFGIKYEYFKFNMVDRLNEYKMFICGEEIVGVPGIGFVEGMACGCAYIGKNDSMYTDLGMIPGVHYIAHDGTLEDIIKKIQYYQEHNDELEIIANSGYDFVQQNLSGEKVATTFYEDLMTLATNHKNNGFDKNKTVFNCSFTQKNEITTSGSL